MSARFIGNDFVRFVHLVLPLRLGLDMGPALALTLALGLPFWRLWAAKFLWVAGTQLQPAVGCFVWFGLIGSNEPWQPSSGQRPAPTILMNWLSVGADSLICGSDWRSEIGHGSSNACIFICISMFSKLERNSKYIKSIQIIKQNFKLRYLKIYIDVFLIKNANFMLILKCIYLQSIFLYL